MAKAVRHLTLRRQNAKTGNPGIWFARLAVPADVQDIVGRRVFIASTGESNPMRANAVAAPWLVDWQDRIQSARTAKADPIKAEIERLAGQYLQHRGDLDATASLLVFDVLDFAFQKLGRLTRAEQRRALLEAQGDVADAMGALPARAKAIDALDHISGRATPILAYLDRWKVATHLKGQSLDQAVSRIKKFASTVNEPIERLTGRHVQVWIESMIQPSDESKGYSVDTLGNYLASLRTYWEYLQSHDIVPLESRPFWNRKLQDRRNEVERAGQDRNRFEPSEVVKLWQMAEELRDEPLAAAIRLAAYSGARREGVCALTVQSIRRHHATGIDYLHFAEKSRSGIRAVPIHSKIADLIKTLVNGADSDGYLIHNTTVNKYGKRGDNIGGRFSRMKATMEFGGQHTFHSIRHTVIYLLRRAECPLEIRKNIVGHAPQGAHEGYGGVIDLTKKQEWLEKAICYPE